MHQSFISISRMHFNFSGLGEFPPHNGSHAGVYHNGCLSETVKYTFGAMALFAKLIAAIINFAIIYTFLTRRRLITPFTIHVVNLLIIDLSSVVTLGPMLIYRQFDNELLKLPIFCALYKYFTWTIFAGIVYQHFIICVDRWLALFAPMWYKDKKGIRHGVYATLIGMLYFHAWFLPMFIQDVMDGAPAGSYCDFPVPRPYVFVVIAVVYIIPELIIYISYPIFLRLLCNKTKVLRKKTMLVPDIFVYDSDGSFRQEFPIGAPDQRSLQTQKVYRGTLGWLTMTLLAIQLGLEIPITVMTILKGVHPTLYCVTDLYNLFYVIGVIALLADPFLYLAFLHELRRDMTVIFLPTFLSSPRIEPLN